MNTETVVLTRELIHAAAMKSGGWTRKQLALVGVIWPPPAGWMEKLVGASMSSQEYSDFVEAGKPKSVARLFDITST